MKWSFADVTAIVRARQKDASYIAQLEGRLRGVVGSILGARILHCHQASIGAIAQVLYYLLTTGMLKSQTLGEEYCSIAPVDVVEGDWPSEGKRLLLTVAQWFRSGRATSDFASMASLASTLHMALFYWSGRYAEWSRRILGLRYVYYPQRMPRPVVGQVYRVLAIATVVTSLPRVWTLLRRVLTKGRRESDAGARPREVSPAARCRLCLGPRKDTTVTACGHLFCWRCIYRWIVRAGKSQCPLCRAACDRAALYCLPADPWMASP